MKKFDLIMLITGLGALVLSIVTFLVLIFVFIAAVRADIKSGRIEEGLEKFGSYMEDTFEEFDDKGIHVEGNDGSIYDIGVNGITVVDGEQNVSISPTGINVATAEN